MTENWHAASFVQWPTAIARREEKLAVADVARFLVLNTSGTHDRDFRDGSEPATHDDLSAAPARASERMEVSNRKHGI
jgi:hypothetical protein